MQRIYLLVSLSLRRFCFHSAQCVNYYEGTKTPEKGQLDKRMKFMQGKLREIKLTQRERSLHLVRTLSPHLTTSLEISRKRFPVAEATQIPVLLCKSDEKKGYIFKPVLCFYPHGLKMGKYIHFRGRKYIPRFVQKSHYLPLYLQSII